MTWKHSPLKSFSVQRWLFVPQLWWCLCVCRLTVPVVQTDHSDSKHTSLHRCTQRQPTADRLTLPSKCDGVKPRKMGYSTIHTVLSHRAAVYTIHTVLSDCMVYRYRYSYISRFSETSCPSRVSRKIWDQMAATCINYIDTAVVCRCMAHLFRAERCK